MSNRACIQATEFHDKPAGSITYGFRIYDNEGQTYDNTWDSIPDDDMEVLKMVCRSDDETVRGIIDFIIEQENGVEIGDEWYDWEQIKPHIQPEEV